MSRSFNIFIISLIILNVLAVALETMRDVSELYAGPFKVFEWFSMAVFSIEYGLRVWTCTVKPEFSSPIRGRIRYMLTPSAIIDLVVVIPFYLPFFFDMDLRFLRVLRLFRLFALFKMARYSQSLHLFKTVLRDTKEELLIVVAATMGLLIFASGVIYFIENKAQPEAFSSIPAAMWWAVSTMTTVGYGDVYPITNLGKIFGVLFLCWVWEHLVFLLESSYMGLSGRCKNKKPDQFNALIAEKESISRLIKEV